MARPSHAELEKEDPFATREAMRMARKHLRKIDLALVRAKEDSRPRILEEFISLWENCRSAEKHHAELLRNPPKPKAKPQKTER